VAAGGFIPLVVTVKRYSRDAPMNKRSLLFRNK